MLGFDEDRLVWFRDLSSTIAVSTDGFGNPDALAAADSAMDELSDHFAEVITTKRGCPVADIVSGLVQLHDTDPAKLSHDELIGNMMLLLTAGFETTAFLTGDGVLAAIDNPEYADRLGTQPFTATYVEEVLRFQPPVHVTSRWASADVTIFDQHIPEGSRVVVVLAAGNRDPRRYPDPNRFDPSRTNSQPLSFGGGIHFCLGAALARREAQIALPMLFRRFPEIALAGEASYRDRWVIRGLRTLPVTTGRAAPASAARLAS
jgi:cytochrome P450